MKSALVLLSLFTSLSAFAFEPVQERLFQESKALKRQGITPVFVFDLDETVLDSTPRRLAAIDAVARSFCSEDPVASSFDRECDLVDELRLEDIYRLPNVYDNAAILESVGIQDPEFKKLIDGKSIAEYLSGRHLELDRPHRGADRFVRALREAGASIYYVSSRYDDTQRAGSMDTLVRNGMIHPNDSRHLFLRRRGQSSIDFKKEALFQIRNEIYISRELKLMVGVYENEPENINAMLELFPDATGVFIEGACIECSVQVDPRAIRIEQF